jgi:NADH-quinone oxidoreductase subunit F
MRTSTAETKDRLAPILKRHGPGGRKQLIPALLEAQAEYGHLPQHVVERIGQGLQVPLAEIHGVIEFYTMLYPQPMGRTIVRVCTSPICAQAGGHAALEAACDYLGVVPGQLSNGGAYQVEHVECLGLCDHAPAALIGDTPVAKIEPKAPRIWIEKPAGAPLGVIGGEPRWLSGRCGKIRPTDLEGFVGRGGAAFPTGAKLEMTAAAQADERFIVCNGDESEPGTFKDRVLMEGDPFFLLEAMTIAGYAAKASKGFVFIRGEYPRAQRIVQQAIDTAYKAGFLGENILGTKFSFDIELRSGAGAYICGEETALFDAIEGKRGYPRIKPPFPTVAGLFGKPTSINNVETLCALAWIVAHGAQAYRAVGTAESPGSKLFCLSGDVARPGVYEVPYGTSLGSLLKLAGGVRGELQAVMLGGAAGAFAGPDRLDLEMSFEGLRKAGLPLGSGVVMAINTTRDLRQALLSLGHFFVHESCGKCFPCRLGTQRQLEIMEKVASRKATREDIAALEDIGYTMTAASLCGLGMTAGSAILSALKLWPEVFVDSRT